MMKYELVIHLRDAYHNVYIRDLDDEAKAKKLASRLNRDGVWDGAMWFPSHRIEYIDLITTRIDDANEKEADDEQGSAN